MTGKATRIPSAADRIRTSQRGINELRGLMRNRNTPKAVATTAFAGASASSGRGGTGNFVDPAGATMVGPFALAPPFDFSIEIDVDGAIDIGPQSTSEQYTSNIQLENIQPNTYTLDTIAGAAFDGQILILRTFAPTVPFTIAVNTIDNGGNIVTPDGSDVSVGDNQMILFVFDEALEANLATDGTWRLLNTFGSGGGDISFPIRYTVDEFGEQGSTSLLLDLNQTAGHYFDIGPITGDINITFQNPPADGTAQAFRINLTQDNVGGHTVTFNDPLLVQPLIGTDADEVTLLAGDIYDGTTYNIFTMTSTAGSGGGSGQNQTPWLSDIDAASFDLNNLANLDFTGVGTTIEGLYNLNFFQTNHEINSISTGDLQLFYGVATGQYHQFSVGGSELFRIGSGQINFSADADMQINSITNTEVLDFDTSQVWNPTGVVALGYDTSLSALKYSTAATNQIHAFYANTTLLGSIFLSSGLSIANFDTAQLDDYLYLVPTTDPSTLANGQIWYNSANNEFQFRQNGGTVGIGGSGSQTPWIQNIDADGFSLISDASGTVPNTGFIRMENNIFHTWIKTDNITTVSFGLGSNDLLSVLGGDLSLQTNNIQDVTTLQGVSAAALNINVPTVSQFLNIQFAGGTEWTFTQTTLGGDSVTLNDALTINDSSAYPNPIIDGQFTRNGTDLGIQIPTFSVRRATTGSLFTQFNIVKEDAAPSGDEPIGELNFQLFDSPTATNYATITGGIIDATDAGSLALNIRADGSNVDIMTIDGRTGSLRADIGFRDNTIIKAEGSGHIGLFTGNAPDNLSTIGTEGTLQMPIVNEGSPTENDLDVAAGNFVGAMCVNINVLNPGLYVHGSTGWRYYGNGSAL